MILSRHDPVISERFRAGNRDSSARYSSATPVNPTFVISVSLWLKSLPHPRIPRIPWFNQFSPVGGAQKARIHWLVTVSRVPENLWGHVSTFHIWDL